MQTIDACGRPLIPRVADPGGADPDPTLIKKTGSDRLENRIRPNQRYTVYRLNIRVKMCRHHKTKQTKFNKKNRKFSFLKLKTYL